MSSHITTELTQIIINERIIKIEINVKLKIIATICLDKQIHNLKFGDKYHSVTSFCLFGENWTQKEIC